MTTTPQKTFLGHPRGLVILFFTEMWERFSFYGMRALLVLYLTQHFLFGSAEAQGIYAAYAALVYLMPVLGGAIADRFLGSRKAVTIGALLLVAGHFTMAFEGGGGREYIQYGGQEYRIEVEGRDTDRQLFAMVGEEKVPITVGPEGIRVSGIPTAAEEAQARSEASSQATVPATATVTDPEAAAVPADGPATAVATSPETLADAVRPGAVTAPGGLPAMIGPDDYEIRKTVDLPGQATLFFALALIIVGVGFLKPNISTVVGSLYEQNDPRRDSGFTIFYVGINLGSILATALCGWLGIQYGWRYGFGLAGVGMLFGLLTFWMGQKWLGGRADPPASAKLDKKTLGVPREAWIYILGILFVIPTWLIVQQHDAVEASLLYLVPAVFAGLLLYSLTFLKGDDRWKMLAAIILTMFSVLFWTLFEQAGSSLTLFADQSTEMPSWFNAAQTQTFNPGVIVVFGPVMAALWVLLAKRGLNPSVPLKFAFGLILVGAGFLLLVWASKNFVTADFKVPLLWLFLAYFLHSIGELCLSPVGLSMITKLSVARMVGMMMGAWFMASALAHIIAGIVAKSTATETVGGVVTNPQLALETYAGVFQTIGLYGVGIGFILLLISPVLKWMMRGVQ
ncbi:MAG: oligopeptide:H+ symporter [Brevundimonas sp.]|uniref:peptide MFS transporter n=1 Tax=Brevundimonas sp. TaxID=1871086 RepID=UPI0024871193|nr:oligopeptide:H+ symporter [Brevundimonas sp.]MDI1328358.1 oligopeptide:H+ symporter [Brevundimonas sp.]